MTTYLPTESDRKSLHKTLWTHYKNLPNLPRQYKQALCSHMVSHICTELAAGNPAYTQLLENLRNSTSPSTTTT